MVHARIRRLILLTALLAGCQQIEWSSEDDDGDWEPPDTGLPPTGEPVPGSDADADADAGPDAEAGDDPAEPKLDLPDASGLSECQLVDLLFVIDNSNSMVAEQQNLIASFDGFIAGIQDNLAEVNDYHIGVITTDAYALNQPGCRELGALVTESVVGACGPWAAGRYITLTDELAPAFTCAANVGPDGDTNERQIAAALRAVGPELAGPGGCNEGFLRPDALLVLVLITDEDDPGAPIVGQGSPGDPTAWFEQLVTLKGVETNVVVLALAGLAPPNACDYDVPFEGAQVTYRVEQFVEKFTYGEMGDVCADDYAPFFDQALGLIAEACSNFAGEG